MLNIVFFGSHQYSLYPLEALFKAGHKIVAIITQPDRPVGRRQILTPTAVKQWATDHQIPIFTTCQADTLPGCITLTPDIGVVCVYGEIIPKEVLNISKYGFLNLHPSLLPKFRGASPAQAAIISGEKETGVTVFLMDEKLDHGPIIAFEKEEIKENDTAETLYHRLFKKGANLILKILPPRPHLSSRASPWNVITEYSFGGKKLELFIPPKPQDDKQAIYTRMLKRNDGFIPWEFVKAAMTGKSLKKKIKIDFIKDNRGYPYFILHTPYFIHNFIRALSPWPGAWTKIKLKMKNEKLKIRRLKLLKSHLEKEKLILDKVQLEGKNPISFKDFQSLILANA